MCGIIGYTGTRRAAPIILEGLGTLEYRGYDSVGIAVIGPDGDSQVYKSSGKLSALRSSLANGLPKGYTGLGHTRWATHGRPTDDNAHPHNDCSGNVTVVHNGIVENYVELKQELLTNGHRFSSQTDSECIPHIVESYLSEGCSLEEAVRETAQRLHGANAVVAVSRNEPDTIVAVRLGNAGGVVVGYGDREMLIASDVPALLQHTHRVVYLADGDMATLTPQRAVYSRLDGAPVSKRAATVPYDAMSAAKGGYRHFMLKEIHEQPSAVIDAMGDRISFDDLSVQLDEMPFTDEEIASFNRVVILGTGTSLHAAMAGRIWIEALARIPAEADNSSEFRYRDPVIDERTLVVSISQSGETADTLAAMDQASAKGARQITLCNYEGAQSTRMAEATILIRAGLEISVASTKTFVCSLTALYILALYLGRRRAALDVNRLTAELRELARLPGMLGALLADHAPYEALARKYAAHTNFLYLGRGLNFPLAMEGALKLKEISYIHAEGYQAAEMKHGPIALIDETMPVVALSPRDGLYEKMLNSIHETKARGGKVIAIATEGDDETADTVDDALYIPATSPSLVPILMAVPMQLLAYFIAVRRGCDVDQPRNLAKTVTVE